MNFATGREGLSRSWVRRLGIMRAVVTTLWRLMTDSDRHFEVPRCDAYLWPGGCPKWAEFVGKQGAVTVGHRCEDHVPKGEAS